MDGTEPITAAEGESLFAPACTHPTAEDPAIEALVEAIIGQVADKWTLLVLEELTAGGTLRFTEIGRRVGGISQKMLTKTLREMERMGLVTRTVHPVVPPHVDYALTDLGHTLGAAFCGVWTWAAENRRRIETAQAAFDEREDARR
ncbi:MAG: helix-turn-helix transcriptional regulator [Phyllobacteriaceae bacterium]|nr:helix-turn-helix transcriptional regulator [Phyllobacteriaceae bacterium]